MVVLDVYVLLLGGLCSNTELGRQSFDFSYPSVGHAREVSAVAVALLIVDQIWLHFSWKRVDDCA